MANQALGTNIITQVGIVVHNIEATAKAWSDIFGLPLPEIMVTDTVDITQAEYDGALSTARAKLAFFNMGHINVELIEPIGEPSTWNDQMQQHGQSLHHIAFQIKGMKDKLAYLDGKGLGL